MKRYLHIFVVGLLLTTSFVARADEGPEFIVEEAQLPRAEVLESTKTQIKIRDIVYEVDARPNKDTMIEAMGLKGEGGVNPLEPYEAMNAESKNQFQQTRLMFLENVARVLHKTQFALGAGSLVGSGFKFVKQKSLQIIGKGTTEAPAETRTFKQRSRAAVQSILQGVDYKLWSQAPMLIEANEFGMSVALGILAEGGARRRGGGGVEELGLSFAYNKSQKAFVFEIYHNSEKFESSKSLVAALGIMGKAGIHFGKRSNAGGLKGGSFYPPVVPGFSMTSPEYFAAGFSSSLGLPPSPFVDIMTFNNKFERTTLLRVTVSPVIKGFVRMHIGDVTRPFVLVALRVVDVYKGVENFIRYRGRSACGPIFAL